MIGAGIRRPRAVYRRNDPAQVVLRKGLEGFSDDDLSKLDDDMSVFIKHGVASGMLAQLIEMSRQIVEFSGDIDALAA